MSRIQLKIWDSSRHTRSFIALIGLIFESFVLVEHGHIIKLPFFDSNLLHVIEYFRLLGDHLDKLDFLHSIVSQSPLPPTNSSRSPLFQKPITWPRLPISGDRTRGGSLDDAAQWGWFRWVLRILIKSVVGDGAAVVVVFLILLLISLPLDARNVELPVETNSLQMRGPLLYRPIRPYWWILYQETRSHYIHADRTACDLQFPARSHRLILNFGFNDVNRLTRWQLLPHCCLSRIKNQLAVI